MAPPRQLPQWVMKFVHARRRPLMSWVKPQGGVPGFNLIGPVHSTSGLGTSVRGYADAIRAAGFPLNIVEWEVGARRAELFDFDHSNQGKQLINLIHLNLDLLEFGHLNKPPINDFFSRSCYNILIPYWELSQIKKYWILNVHRFDEVWCASSFIAGAIRRRTIRPVRVVRPALHFAPPQQRLGRKDFGLPDNKFIFFYCADVSSVMGRKNPGAFLESYVKEFSPGDGAFCLLKLHDSQERKDNPFASVEHLVRNRPDVFLMYETMTKERMDALFEVIDCYVSPHRSEGLGLTILEAMHAAKPVIATPYGGSADFVKKRVAYPLDYKLVPVPPGNHPYDEEPDVVWADPQPSSLRRLMRRVFERRDEASQTGARGHDYARRLFSREETAWRITREVRRIWRNG